MAEKCPRNSQEMLNVSGVGQHKLAQYGQPFLNFFANLPQVVSILKPSMPVAKKMTANTYEETLSLYKAGLTVEEIATRRNLNINTIYSHMASLYSKDKIDSLDPFISKDEVQLLCTLIPEFATKPALKEIFEKLNGTMEYYKIKLILAHVNKWSAASD
jgi:ATP-dependent DNA helicase RecQ